MNKKASKDISSGALSRRAALAQTFIISTVVLVFSLLIIGANAYRLDSQVDSRINSIAALAETSLETAVWQVDHESARDFISAVIQDPMVVFAQVVTGRETMAARTKTPFMGKTFAYFKEDSIFRTREVEIKKHGDWIGTFRLAVSIESIKMGIIYNALGTLAMAIVMIIAISQTSLYFSRKRLFLPLKRLETSAMAIAEGNLDAVIDTHLPGELGSLARSIDDMRDSLRHLISDLQISKGRLEDHRNALEKGIQDRTKELEQKNDSLNKALKDVQQAKQNAEVASIAKANFLASMSHEIRTPMNAILGMADVLSETQLDNDQAHYVQVFRNAGENLLEILDDILDLSKIEAGHLTLESLPFTLSKALDKTCKLIEPKAQSKGLDFSCTMSSDLPNRFVGDQARLRQVIHNLVGNAVKFTESGHVHLKVASASASPTSPLIQFSVTDTGPGIPTKKLDTIFDSFTQVDSSTTRKFGGTGLGLAITKELVNMMDGRIWVESAHGSGSTFHFTVRLDTDTSERKPLTPPPFAKDQTGPLPEARILMIEDSKYNAFVIHTYLKNTQCALTTIENGKDGLVAFKEGDYDCVLMDIQMPVMDGYETTRAIREWETEQELERTPIIAMTAFAKAEDAKLCFEAGADNHLPKPVKKSSLFSMLQEVISPKSSRLSHEAEDLREEIQKSITAARAAIERGDTGSLNALGNDIANRGQSLELEDVTALGRSLTDIDGDTFNAETAAKTLNAITELVESKEKKG